MNQRRDTLRAMLRGRLHLILIPLAALIPILALILRGCSCGHDFDFHVLNWLEAARHFTSGDLRPQWAGSPAWNAGEPRFVFYPPISWTVGAILGLILPWTWTPIAYTWLILTAAGFALRRLALSFASPTASVLAAVFYLANPYTLFTAYERTAYAELLAAIWLPLLLHAILRPDREGGVTIQRIAVPLALLWLSNAPAAVIGCYALALLAAVRLILERQDRIRLALTTATGTVLGLGLASSYIVPAAWERRYVQIQMAILPGLSIQDNFPFHHTTSGITDPAALAEAVFHDNVLHTASVVALLLLVLTATALLYLAKTSLQGTDRAPLYALATVGAAIAVLLTPISTPIWHYAPELAFLQFPWRILALLAAVLGLTVALCMRAITLKPAATLAIALTAAAALALPAYTLFRQSCDPEDTVAARTDAFRSNQGTEPTDEYTPITADNDSLAKSNPPYWLASTADEQAPTNTAPGTAPHDLRIDSANAQYLILNLRDYPAWRVTRNGAPVLDREQRSDGLIAIPLPPGSSQIAVRYVQLLDQTIGLILTALSLVLLSILVVRSRGSQGTQH